jgi:hypothetical protein
MSIRKIPWKVSVAIAITVMAVSGWIIFNFLRRSMMLAYTDTAIGTIRTIVTAEEHFAADHPDLGYTCAMADLKANEMLGGLAKTGQRNGYAFELICTSGGNSRPQRSFQVTARPLNPDLPAYCSDQSGVLRYDAGGSTAKCLQDRVRF